METAIVNVVSEYNNGLVKTKLMKYALTAGEVYPSTSRFSEQRDTVKELRKTVVPKENKDSSYEAGAF